MLLPALSFRLSDASAFPAASSLPVFTLGGSVLRRVFMSIRTMCFSFISFPVGFSTKRKAGKIPLMLAAKNFFNWPSKVYSLINGLVRYAKFCGPFHCRLPFAVKFNKTVASSIAHLLRSCRPSAIIGTITLICVNPIKGHSFGWKSHVLNKIFKTIFPSVADGYSPAPVIFKSRVVGVVASLFHLVINCADFCFAKAMFLLFFFRHVLSLNWLKDNMPHNRYGVNSAV